MYHNRTGGAKYTKNKRGEGGRWDYHGIIPGLGKIMALSIEKKVQLKTRKSKGSTPLLRRVNGAAITYAPFLTILSISLDHHSIPLVLAIKNVLSGPMLKEEGSISYTEGGIHFMDYTQYI